MNLSINNSDLKPSSETKKWLGPAFIALYILIRWVPDGQFWRNISEYYAYGFEALYVITVYACFRKKITLWHKPGVGDLAIATLSCCMGFMAYRGASLVGLTIPFDLSGIEMIFLLVIFGPVLEELIFRMALWEAIKECQWGYKATLVATTILFAGGHMLAFWYVPDDYKGFVVYQTLYVLLLGAVAGWRRFLANNVLAAIWVHISFNFGFYLASL